MCFCRSFWTFWCWNQCWKWWSSLTTTTAPITLGRLFKLISFFSAISPVIIGMVGQMVFPQCGKISGICLRIMHFSLLSLFGNHFDWFEQIYNTTPSEKACVFGVVCLLVRVFILTIFYFHFLQSLICSICSWPCLYWLIFLTVIIHSLICCRTSRISRHVKNVISRRLRREYQSPWTAYWTKFGQSCATSVPLVHIKNLWKITYILLVSAHVA